MGNDTYEVTKSAALKWPGKKTANPFVMQMRERKKMVIYVDQGWNGLRNGN